ncbi:toxin-antitoxin system YwqK family antitoxin [Flavobacterium silvaticum]|uniref:Toxin-antitoxin system YwqK family antitoxin n=1 Tax=Flavobacterium silvaticum TaxID=1852020 RepID=A0A972JIN7_9FLAO|nr:hypothetical protein [Flavobacterium silvaticum]NMH28468.1 hypothetical protein [Flavobacterium silvaticum]
MGVRLVTVLFLALSFISCATNRTKNGKRIGLWIEKDTVAGQIQITRGRYKDGLEKNTWKTYLDGKLVKREVYRDSICHVFHFYPDGSVSREGYTRIANEGVFTHWFYFGDWYSYDTDGKLVSVDTYYQGELVGEKDAAP